MDALYFFGYALARYHALPFTLGDARFIRARSVGTGRGAMTSLEVHLPPALTTHCRRQRFYVDADGRIVRHDYQADVVGPLAYAAHFWNRQTLVNGFPIAMERHVLFRLGRTVLPMTTLYAAFDEATVEYAHGTRTGP